jgi:hypothetical protein
LVAATPAASVTARNVERTGRARLGFGELRDVVMVDTRATSVRWDDGAPSHRSLFVERCGWNPTDEPFEFVLLAFRPRRIQVWNSIEELFGRDVMRNGQWLEDNAPPS